MNVYSVELINAFKINGLNYDIMEKKVDQEQELSPKLTPYNST